MKFSFIYKGKNFSVDAKKCENIFSKMRGLMFRKNSKPLLFVFHKPVREPIHSFFCKPFIAIWFLKDEIIDVKFIEKWRPFIRPEKEFDKILELPFSSIFFDYFHRRITTSDDRKV